MSDSDTSSSDDDVAHLIAKTKEKYYESQRKRRRSADGDDESSATSVAEVAVVRTEVVSKLERLEQDRRIRERARQLQRSTDDDDSDDDVDEDGDGADGAMPRIVDKQRLHVDVKIQCESDIEALLELSSDDEEHQARRPRQPSLPGHQNNQELLAIQAACEQLKTAQRYKASCKEKIASASPPTSPPSSTVCLVEEWTLVVECKLMLQGKIHSKQTIQVQIWNNATIAELLEEILNACNLSDQAAVVSTLTTDDKVLCKRFGTRSTKSLSSCPTLRSGSVLSATLHLTGLSTSKKKDTSDLEEEEQRNWGRLITVCLRRIVGKKEEREQWSIREREPFSNLISRYQEKYKVLPVFQFDGDTIDPCQKPDDHDMEDEDLIDVVERCEHCRERK